MGDYWVFVLSHGPMDMMDWIFEDGAWEMVVGIYCGLKLTMVNDLIYECYPLVN